MHFFRSYFFNHIEREKCDILVVSSCGGHLKQIIDLQEAYDAKKVFLQLMIIIQCLISMKDDLSE